MKGPGEKIFYKDIKGNPHHPLLDNPKSFKEVTYVKTPKYEGILGKTEEGKNLWLASIRHKSKTDHHTNVKKHTNKTRLSRVLSKKESIKKPSHINESKNNKYVTPQNISKDKPKILSNKEKEVCEYRRGLQPPAAYKLWQLQSYKQLKGLRF